MRRGKWGSWDGHGVQVCSTSDEGLLRYILGIDICRAGKFPHATQLLRGVLEPPPAWPLSPPIPAILPADDPAHVHKTCSDGPIGGIRRNSVRIRARRR